MIEFFFGKDTYRSHQKLLFERERFLRDMGDDSARFEVDFSDTPDEMATVQNTINALQTGGLFSSKKVVVVKRLFFLSTAAQELLKKFLEGAAKSIANDTDTALLVWDDRADKRTKIFALLSKKASGKEDFSPLSGSALAHWARQELAEISPKTNIAPAALARLTEETGSNTGRIRTELEKLSLICTNETITEEDVRVLTAENDNGIIFNALDALGNGDKRKALSLLRGQLSQGKHPLYLLTMCAYHIRQLLAVASLREEASETNAAAIARRAKIAPFVAQKLLRQTEKFPLKRARRALSLLAKFDVSVKTGKMMGEIAVDEFIFLV